MERSLHEYMCGTRPAVPVPTVAAASPLPTLESAASAPTGGAAPLPTAETAAERGDVTLVDYHFNAVLFTASLAGSKFLSTLPVWARTDAATAVFFEWAQEQLQEYFRKYPVKAEFRLQIVGVREGSLSVVCGVYGLEDPWKYLDFGICNDWTVKFTTVEELRDDLTLV